MLGNRKVGFDIHIQLSTKSTDGFVIIQGLISCLSNCCEPQYDPVSHSCFFIQNLNLSGTNITDECLDSCFPMLSLLEVLDLKRCPLLKLPLRSTHAPHKHLQTVLLDGCWQLDESHLLEFEDICISECMPATGALADARPPVFIDVLHADILPGSSSKMEVVILSAPHVGEWVRCTVTHTHAASVITAPPDTDASEVCRKSPSKSPRSAAAGDLGCTSSTRRQRRRELKIAKYDIFVWETLKFDHAVGFSSLPALNISRKHLRYCS
jgi:hypothetical protein